MSKLFWGLEQGEDCYSFLPERPRNSGVFSRLEYLIALTHRQLKMSALLILASGAEEMETVIPADVLRRGKVSNNK